MSKFTDGLTDLVRNITNRRNPLRNNQTTTERVDDSELRAIYKTGLGSKICRLKAGYALDDTIQFANTDDEIFYNRKLAKSVKKAAKLSVAFGRSVIVILERGGDLSQPLPKSLDPATTRLEVFGGDQVTVPAVNLDLASERYMRPMSYFIRGYSIHHTRVIDFKYVEPPELDAPTYRYGGISEFELIRPQIIADEIVQRAVPAILEKSSSFFYKMTGFKDMLQSGQTEVMQQWISSMEDMRSIFGAGVIDAEDDVLAITQALSNLAESDQITLRRLAMVTGIPLSLLVGENVKGLNATGDNERAAFQDMIETLQSEYLLDPINEFMRKFGQDEIEFKNNQGQTPNERLDVEVKVIDNAVKLAGIGEDYVEYLRHHDICKPDLVDGFMAGFEPTEDDEDDELETVHQLLTGGNNEA